MSDERNNPHGLEERRPTPEQSQAIREATAFAYGYAQAMYIATKSDHHFQQANRLREDLELFDCFLSGTGILKGVYLTQWLRGNEKASMELEAKNL